MLFEYQWQVDGVWVYSHYTSRCPQEKFTRYRVYEIYDEKLEWIYI